MMERLMTVICTCTIHALYVHCMCTLSLNLVSICVTNQHAHSDEFYMYELLAVERGLNVRRRKRWVWSKVWIMVASVVWGLLSSSKCMSIISDNCPGSPPLPLSP